MWVRVSSTTSTQYCKVEHSGEGTGPILRRHGPAGVRTSWRRCLGRMGGNRAQQFNADSGGIGFFFFFMLDNDDGRMVVHLHSSKLHWICL